MLGERRSLLLGRGSFLSEARCQSIVSHLYARAWWRRSEMGEGDDCVVDLTACCSLWCDVGVPHRDLVIRRLDEIARAAGGPGVRTRREEPVVFRYTKGGFFRRHRDTYERPANAVGRRMSFIAFLTGAGRPDGFLGGELRFHFLNAEAGRICVRVPGRVGQFVVFSADVEHEVLPVLAGERITLTSWLY